MPHHRVAKCRSVARADAHRAHITPLAYALSPNENKYLPIKRRSCLHPLFVSCLTIDIHHLPLELNEGERIIHAKDLPREAPSKAVKSVSS